MVVKRVEWLVVLLVELKVWMMDLKRDEMLVEMTVSKLVEMKVVPKEFRLAVSMVVKLVD